MTLDRSAILAALDRLDARPGGLRPFPTAWLIAINAGLARGPGTMARLTGILRDMEAEGFVRSWLGEHVVLGCGNRWSL